MMKEDYLWDKSGAADPEIERLENALAVFRYQADEPPALPAKIIPFESKSPRRSFFRLAFAFTACAALVLISAGVWFQLDGEKVQVAGDSTETAAPLVIEKADEILAAKPDASIVENLQTPQSPVERNAVKNTEAAQVTRKPTRNKSEKHIRFARVSANSIQTKKSAVKLTTEEKYAYDQLMLALSVTSSTFKKVKDKVESVEGKTAVHTGGR